MYVGTCFHNISFYRCVGTADRGGSEDSGCEFNEVSDTTS